MIPAPTRPAWHFALALVALVAAAYTGAIGCGFVGFDDLTHVLENRVVVEGDVAGAFARASAGLWVPLTWLSFMADRVMGGGQPWMFHLTNVLLHAANTLLVWRWLEGVTGRRWPAVIVAACFAVHPLNVESVAWITERKNVLSTFFWLLALMAWMRFGQTGRWWDYLFTLVAGAAGLMSKPALVVLPGTLLLLDAWPLGRLKRCGWYRILVEKLPFAAMSVAITIVTMAAHGVRGGLSGVEGLPLGTRLLNGMASYALYLQELVWPFGLAIQTRSPVDIPALEGAIGTGIVVVLTALALRMVRSQPAVLWGWLWFIVTLLPSIGFIQAGAEASADRFMYVPGLGIFVALAQLFTPWAEAQPRLVRWAGAAVLIGWMALTIRQITFWKDGLTLFDRALAINPHSHRALVAAGDARMARGNFRGAVTLYHEALEMYPMDGPVWANIGLAMARMGDQERARFALRKALEIDPKLDKARRTLEELTMTQASEGSH